MRTPDSGKDLRQNKFITLCLVCSLSALVNMSARIHSNLLRRSEVGRLALRRPTKVGAMISEILHAHLTATRAIFTRMLSRERAGNQPPVFIGLRIPRDTATRSSTEGCAFRSAALILSLAILKTWAKQDNRREAGKS